MSQVKLLAVFGTRPEAIKMAPLVKSLGDKRFPFTIKVAVTAQHREMLDQVLQLFQISPDYDLNIMQAEQDLAQVTVRALEGVSAVIREERPDMVLVHGDTTTTMAAALAAFYSRTPVAHVEAGLRTYCKYAPFPEEINRHLVGVLGDLHFCPTQRTRENLLAEGVPAERINVTGNTVIDALLSVVQPDYHFTEPELDGVNFSRRVILITAHRRENWGAPMEDIFTALREVVCRYPDVEIIFPVHKNPRLRQQVRAILHGVPRVHLIEPLEYAPFVNVMARCHLVLTDSGGLQEEAPALGKPVLVLREVTERPEAVAAGTVKLVGSRQENIVAGVSELLEDDNLYQQMARAVNPYGDGKAVSRICHALAYYWEFSPQPPEEFDS
ncbi:MAG: UDP-N-acetylglucosamine 2-epimerase (non-hydrolyzing) [Clostridia bacterium]|nr:MAG: UDP-N-acetylglucosamine 2-epimerase (non-hydrolyzing) [Clostridia bacterium]